MTWLRMVESMGDNEGLADRNWYWNRLPEPAIVPEPVAPAPVSAPATLTPAPVAEPPAPAPVSVYPVAPVAAPAATTSPHLPAPAPPPAVVNDNPMDFDRDLTDADVVRYVNLPIEDQIKYEDNFRRGMARTSVSMRT